MGSRVFAAVFIVLSLVFLLVMVPGLQAESAANPMFQITGLGPAAIPYFAGGAVLILSIAMMFERPEQAPETPPERAAPRRAEFKNVGIAVALIVGFLALMPFAGFLVAGILFLGAFFLAFRSPSVLTAAVIAVAAPLTVDLLLRKVFLIPLPQLGWF